MGRKGLSKGLFLAAVLLLIMVMLYSGLQILESTVLQRKPPVLQNGDPGHVTDQTAVRDDVKYYPRQDITVVMLLGIDDEGPVRDSGFYNNTGGADMVALLIFDKKAEVCNLLLLNRDSMVEMPVLGLGGKPAGTYYGQLALSHTWGSGLKDSCENTRTTVSNMLLGVPIDYYMALNMDGIGILNDAVGGVTVTIQDDFSAVDESLVMGQTICLNAKQAMSFVRSRQGVGNGLNQSRMERHEQYMDGFVAGLRAHLASDPVYASRLMEQVSDYLVTDCSTTVLNRLVTEFQDYPLMPPVSPKGENVRGEKYHEFYVDQEDLERLALELFFAPIH